MDSELGESRWRKNVPAGIANPGRLNWEGLGIGEGLFADADTFLLLGSGVGQFSGHGGYVERNLVKSG